MTHIHKGFFFPKFLEHAFPCPCPARTNYRINSENLEYSLDPLIHIIHLCLKCLCVHAYVHMCMQGCVCMYVCVFFLKLFGLHENFPPRGLFLVLFTAEEIVNS